MARLRETLEQRPLDLGLEGLVAPIKTVPRNRDGRDKVEQEPGEPTVSPRNTLNDLTGREWIAETKSVWFQKGLGAKHPDAQIERQHPAPYSFQDVSRLIQFFTKAGGRVLDPFVGVGSTLKACALTGRYGVGVELTSRWVELSRERLLTEVGSDALETQEIIQGDARRVLADSKRFSDASFDFSVCSPPYGTILTKKADHKVRTERLDNGLAKQYSDDAADLGNITNYTDFLEQLGVVFSHVYRVLKPGKYACIVVGDYRNKNQYVPFHADLIRLLTSADVAGPRYELHGITVLVQNHKNLYPYGYPFAYVPNMHHQYILILRKPKDIAPPQGDPNRKAMNPLC